MNLRFTKVMSEMASLRTEMASLQDGLDYRGLEGITR